MTAIANEAQMPAWCHTNLPLSRVRDLLTPEEIALYKAKLEERNDHERVYCPVPTCSAYVSKKLYSHLIENPEVSEKLKTLDTEETNQQPSLSNESFDTKATGKISSISCPKCAAEICFSCKQLSHDGELCKWDHIDQDEIAKALNRSTLQKCPKCHIITERVTGCQEIQCRCGTQ